jgi:hypothetical protein
MSLEEYFIFWIKLGGKKKWLLILTCGHSYA